MLRRVQIPDAPAHLDQPLLVEGEQAHLDVARVVPLRVAREVDVQALGEGRQALDAIGSVEERGRAGDEDVEPREAPAVQVVDELADGFEAPVAAVGANALDGLDLVENEQEARSPALLQHRE